MRLLPPPETRERRPLGQEAAPHSSSALDDTLTSSVDDRRRRAQVLRSCGAAYEHLRRHGLLSEVVTAELRRILREAS